MRRVTRPDTHVPCNFANQLELLPSFPRVLATAAELLDLELTWIPPEPQQDDRYAVTAIGSAPSDETVIVVEWLVQPGAIVRRGDAIASLEAAKNVFDMTSPVDGTVQEILAAEGETVEVGAPLMNVKTDPAQQPARPTGHQSLGTPVLVRRPKSVAVHLPRRSLTRRPFDVGISSVAAVTGSRLVHNSELLALHGDQRHASMNAEDIFRRTGIEKRHWATPDEDAVSMAVRASWKLLDQENLSLDDIDLLICSTTSPVSVTPSMACRVLSGLSGGKIGAMLQAFDINAACSGYLYAMQAGYDYLQSTPEGRVLIVTAEVLSPLLDRNDLDTAILFGDATSASILYGESHFPQAKARIYRPDLSARGEDGTTLSVPFRHDGFIQMQGRKVFSEAVRAMVASLNHACQRQGIDVGDLSLVVPHQANQRIIDAIERRVNVPVYSNIREYGNTSSSSIPLCLHDVLPQIAKGEQLGLCAFGGGLTFGAGILEAA
jgi:2-oxoisovalerate dehydrogenase E1 component